MFSALGDGDSSDGFWEFKFVPEFSLYLSELDILNPKYEV